MLGGILEQKKKRTKRERAEREQKGQLKRWEKKKMGKRKRKKKKKGIGRVSEGRLGEGESEREIVLTRKPRKVRAVCGGERGWEKNAEGESSGKKKNIHPERGKGGGDLVNCLAGHWCGQQQCNPRQSYYSLSHTHILSLLRDPHPEMEAIE